MTEPGATPATGAARWKGKKIGHFKLIDMLGRGAMAWVFRAEDLNLGRHVALKIFPTQVKKGETTTRLERFLREAKAQSTLEHPGIVRVFEAGESGGWCYIAMELVEGGSLEKLISASGPLDVVRAAQVIAEVGEALEFAHDHGVIHRDVKPANVMLARGGRAKLGDFGLAFRSDPSDSFYLNDEPVGTAFYIAPEVVRGKPATPQSDLYGLGATLYFLLTGNPPYAGSSRQKVIRQHLHAPVPDIREARPDVPDSLAQVIAKAMAKNPEDRFLSTEQFAKVLRVYTIGGGVGPSASGVVITPNASAPISAQPVMRTPREGGKTVSMKVPIIAAAVCGLAAIVAITAMVMSGGEKETAGPVQPNVTNVEPANRPAASPAAVVPQTPAPRPAPTPQIAIPQPPPITPGPNAVVAVIEPFDEDAGSFNGFPNETVRGTLVFATEDGRRFARLGWTFNPDESRAQAAYLRLDRPVGVVIQIECDARGNGTSPVQVKAAFRDGNNARQLISLHDGPLPTTWTRLRGAISQQIEQPLMLESIYVVSTDPKRYAQAGTIDIDQITVIRPDN